MKRLPFSITMALMVCVLLFTLVGSCSTGSLPASYMSFTIGDSDYVFDKGLTDIESEAFGNVYSGSLVLVAASEPNGDSFDPPTDHVHIRIGSSMPGTYTTEIDSILSFGYRENDTYHPPQFPATSTVTIDKIDDIGGYIEGSFELYAQDGFTLTSGIIKVKRIANDSFLQWP